MEIILKEIELRDHPDIPRLNIKLDKKLWLKGDYDLALEDIGNIFYLFTIMNNREVFRQWCEDNITKPMTIILEYSQYGIDYFYHIVANKEGIVLERLALNKRFVYHYYNNSNNKPLLELPENTQDLFQSIMFIDFTNDKWEEMHIEQSIFQCVEFRDSEFFTAIYKGLKELFITDVPLDIRDNTNVMYYDVIEQKYINIRDADTNIKQCFILITLAVVAQSLNSIVVFNVLDNTVIDYDKRIQIIDFINRYSQFILIDFNASQYKAQFKDDEVMQILFSNDDYIVK